MHRSREGLRQQLFGIAWCISCRCRGIHAPYKTADAEGRVSPHASLTHNNPPETAPGVWDQPGQYWKRMPQVLLLFVLARIQAG
jgi:hypothetical protein